MYSTSLNLLTDLLFSSADGFTLIMILFGGLIGFLSAKFSIASYGAFVVFIYVGSNTNLFMYESLMYVILVVMLLGMGMKIWQTISNDGVEQ